MYINIVIHTNEVTGNTSVIQNSLALLVFVHGLVPWRWPQSFVRLFIQHRSRPNIWGSYLSTIYPDHFFLFLYENVYIIFFSFCVC